MATTPAIITPGLLPAVDRFNDNYQTAAIRAIVQNTATNAQMTQALVAALGAGSTPGATPSPAAKAGITEVLPLNWNIQDFIDAAVAAGVTNLAPTETSGLAITVAAGATFSFTNTPTQVNGQPQVWVLGDSFSISTDTVNGALTVTGTIDGKRVVLNVLPMLRESYSFRLSRFLVVTSALDIVVVNGTSNAVTVNPFLEYVPLDRSLYTDTLRRILQAHYAKLLAFGAALKEAGQ